MEKNRVKIILKGLIFSVLMFSAVNFASAQTISGNSNTQNTSRSWGTTGNPILEFTVVPVATGTPEWIQTEMNRSDVLTPDRLVWVTIADNSTGIVLATSSLQAGSALDVVPSLPHTFGTNARFTFTTGLVMSTGITYRIQYRISALENTYPYGSAGSTSGGTGQGTCCGGPYYMRYTLSGSPIDNATTSISFPFIISGSSYQDMNLVTTQHQMSSSTVGDGRILVYFSTSTPSNAYDVVYAIAYNSQVPLNTTIALNKSLWLGTSTTWYAYAYLYNAGYSQVLASTSIYFVISSPFINSDNAICGVSPFSYICQLQTIFSGLGYSTISVPSFQIAIPPLLATTTITFSSTTFSTFYGTDNWNRMYSAITIILWAGFILYAYFRVKNIV